MIDTQSASLETEECTIIADRSQFQVLFENLFRNAIGHGGRNVAVRVGPVDEGFYVEDTGNGIPPQERDHVFDHGYTTGYGGSGVGLTIVKRIATDHDLEVSSLTVLKVVPGLRFEIVTEYERNSPSQIGLSAVNTYSGH